MKIYRIIYKTIGFLIHTIISGVITLIVVILVMPFMNKRKATAYMGKFWSKGIIKIFGIKVVVHGKPTEKGVFFVSNHQSYLDIIILYSKFPIIFVSKHDVKKWPLIGLLAMLAGTIFIDRSKKTSAKKYVKQIIDVVNHNVNILIFPEGTSTDGSSVIPFKTPLFQAVVDTKSKIRPVYTEYNTINKQIPDRELLNKVCWYGDMDFAPHVFKFLTLKSVKIIIHLGDIIKCPEKINSREGRKILAQQTHQAVAKLKKRADEQNYTQQNVK